MNRLAKALILVRQLTAVPWRYRTKEGDDSKGQLQIRSDLYEYSLLLSGGNSAALTLAGYKDPDA